MLNLLIKLKNFFSDSSRPYVICEYMHSMGNSTGGAEIWIIYQDNVVQGGFVWDWMDQVREPFSTFRKNIGVGPVDTFCIRRIL